MISSVWDYVPVFSLIAGRVAQQEALDQLHDERHA